MTDTRALASALARLDDERLSRILRRAPVSVTRVADYFELADSLLSPDALAVILGPVPRDVLAGLAAGSFDADSSQSALRYADEHPEAALILFSDGGGDPVPRSDIADYLRSDEAAIIRDRLAAPEPRVHDTDVDEESEREGPQQAFQAVLVIAEALYQAETSGLSVTARGVLTQADAQRLAEIVSATADEVQELVVAARMCGYAGAVGSRLRRTAEGARWQTADPPAQWLSLVRLWWSMQPAPLRTLAAAQPAAVWDDAFREYTSWRYPALHIDPDRDDRRARVCGLLGLLHDRSLTALGRGIAVGSGETLDREVEKAFPPTVAEAFVQHDMTIIAPGPLGAHADDVLHRIADTEHRSYASRFRVSQTSLLRGLRSGLSLGDVRETLRELSPSPLPQPLEYLLAEIEAHPERHSPGAGAEGLGVLPDPAAEATDAIVARLRASATGDPEAAWIERQLREAIRLRSSVVVTVRMPDGEDHEYALQPSGIASGRLRARDARADVERTLPISLIRDVRDQS